MAPTLHPVREFFYKDGNQPCFSFDLLLPINLIENQKKITGEEYQYSKDEYLKYSYIYKMLYLAMRDSLFVPETKIFLGRFITANMPGVLTPKMKEIFINDLPQLEAHFSSSEQQTYKEYINEGLEKAYLFSHNNLCHQMWNKWFEKCATFEQISEILFYNWKNFEEAYQSGLGSTKVNNNTKWLAEFFSLNEKEEKVLEIFLFEELLSPLSYVLTQATSHRYYPLLLDIEAQMDWLAKIYDVQKKEILSFLKNKKLIESGLIKNILKGDKFFTEVVLEKKSLSSAFFDPRFLLLLRASFEDKNSLIDTIINIEKDFEAELSLNDYTYLNPELNAIINSLKNSKESMDILFWGMPGTGKTQLAKAIAKESGFDLCNITKYDTEDRDTFYKNQRISQLTNAKNFSTILKNYVILVDEAENILVQKEIKHLLTEQLENKKVHTIWVVNHIENIDPAYLRRFDYIQEIKGMPFEHRRNLSSKLLNGKHEDLSYKIAQAMHTPAEIVSAIKWCNKSNQFTWDSIQTKMAAYQKALSKSDKIKHQQFAIEIIPPEQNKEKGLKNFAGYEYLHESANQIKDLFNNPAKYQKMGAKVPKGILLAGAPGVGKTLFAKCLANEISIPIIRADCSCLAANTGAIAELFEQARSHAPCMIFLDEIDVIASNVMEKNGPNTEKQKILNQLLVQMDGFNSLEGVLVLGATHRDNLLDSAVKRSGRFGETIYIRNPADSDRKKIWEFYGKSVLLDKKINYDILSKLSATMSAADINQAVNMAAMSAASKDNEVITQTDMEDACNKLFWGTDAQGMPIAKQEQWKTAVHEAGHALIALKNKQGVKRATVRPHLNFLGAVDLDKPEGTYSITMQQIKQNSEIFFGGMVAEQIVFGFHANGVISDLSRASSFVMDALLSYGMGETLGSTVITQNTPSMSEARVLQLENEHKTILEEAKTKTLEWLTENKKLLIDLASLLITKRSLNQTELYEWFHTTIHKENLTLIEEDNDCSFEQLIAKAYAE